MTGYRYFIAFFITFACLSANSSTYYGRVVDNSSPAKPIANATVSVQSGALLAYTDAAGMFSFNFTAISSIPASYRFQNLRCNNGTLLLSCTRKQLLRLKLYSVSGKSIALVERSLETGAHAFSLTTLIPRDLVPGLYVLMAETGGTRYTVPLLLTNSTKTIAAAGRTTASRQKAPDKTGLAGSPLTVSKKGYEPATRLLADAMNELGDIVLSRTVQEADIERKTDSILAIMTIDEKAGQMVQAQVNFTNTFPDRLTDSKIASMAIGSVFNGGSDQSADGQPNTPAAWAAVIDRTQKAVLDSSRLKIPIIYAQDCVHGVGEINGCTIFPHNIGLGCTGDTALVAKSGSITAAECAGIGIRFNFAPCISSVRNERWGRTYEGFGETPEINTIMGAAYIRGLQGYGDMAKSGAVVACAKHFLGDGGTVDGVNNGEVTISEATMRAVHLPPYIVAAREQVATVMPSYHTWVRSDGSWKQTLDKYALTSVLKTELGFDGFCISDWDAVARACENYKVDCVARAVNAGLDMAMIIGEWNCGEFVNSIKEGVKNQIIAESRINDAVRRILRIKYRFGLFEHPYSDPTLRSRIGNAESKAVARECVRKSMVLLKNENAVLPLQKTERIAVVGPWANSLGSQCGGWTISWQGANSHTGIAGQTILQGLQEKGSNVYFSETGDALANADKIVVVVGENPYAEQYGDCEVPDFSACPNATLIEKCYNSGKPVILVMVTGRPMIIDTEINWCKAIVAAWLPGSEAGGVADILFGDFNFSGTLTHTWPASANQIPINTGSVYADEPKGSGGEPLFPFGFGLRYNR